MDWPKILILCTKGFIKRGRLISIFRRVRVNSKTQISRILSHPWAYIKDKFLEDNHFEDRFVKAKYFNRNWYLLHLLSNYWRNFSQFWTGVQNLKPFLQLKNRENLSQFCWVEQVQGIWDASFILVEEFVSLQVPVRVSIARWLKLWALFLFAGGLNRTLKPIPVQNRLQKEVNAHPLVTEQAQDAWCYWQHNVARWSWNCRSRAVHCTVKKVCLKMFERNWVWIGGATNISRIPDLKALLFPTCSSSLKGDWTRYDVGCVNVPLIWAFSGLETLY